MRHAGEDRGDGAGRGLRPAALPPSFYDDPYPTYRALRETAPVKRMPDGSIS